MTAPPPEFITADKIIEHGHPVWTLTGPLGNVTYRSLGNGLCMQPHGAATPTGIGHPDELKKVAATGGNVQVFELLRTWYDQLPGLAAGGEATEPDPFAEYSRAEMLAAWQKSIQSGRPVTLAERMAYESERHAADPAATAISATEPGPETGNPEVDQWRGLRGDDLVQALLAARWYVREDDIIGGWGIMPADLPPSSGLPEVGTFIAQGIAEHIVKSHNAALDAAERTAGYKAQYEAAVAARPEVQVGDIVYVPAGADTVCTIAHRIRADHITNIGVSGPRVKANGTLMVSRSVINQTGYVQGVAGWPVVAKSTIIRNGQTVYSPGEKR